jgi:hypothetical protein
MKEAVHPEADSRIAGWQAPRRPDWVLRVNEEGRSMDARALVPLDERSLLDWAVRNTGLSDFGDERWRQPFRILIKGLEEEAALHLMGRMMARQEVLIWLQNRLQMTDLLKRHPEIREVRIDRPLFIIGIGRSGTTVLFEILARDPNLRVLLGWEALLPCSPPETATDESDPRIDKADKLLTQINRVVPEHAGMHDIGARVPIECGSIMASSFLADQLAAFYQSPSYAAWLAQADWTEAYEYHRSVLQVLQWKNARKHWLLKAPNHLAHLPQLLEVYPDARLIQTHRDPLITMASVTDLLGTLYWTRSDQPFNTSAFEGLTFGQGVAGQLENVIELRRQGVIGASTIIDVLYRDLLDDPLGIVAQIYRHFQMDLSTEVIEAMRKFLAAKGGALPGTHRYQVGSAATIARDRPLFARYQTHYGVPNEV